MINKLLIILLICIMIKLLIIIGVTTHNKSKTPSHPKIIKTCYDHSMAVAAGYWRGNFFKVHNTIFFFIFAIFWAM
jgi:hypothetical protein